MAIIWIWNGNEGKNRCVAVFCPMSVRRIALTGSWLAFLQNAGLAVAAARADRGMAVPVPTTKLCSARLSGLRKKPWIVLYGKPCSFLDIWCRLCVTKKKTAHLLFSTDSLQQGIQVVFWTTLAFFFAVIASLDWVFLKQMQSSHFSNLYCLFYIDSSWNPAKGWRLKLFIKHCVYKSW